MESWECPHHVRMRVFMCVFLASIVCRKLNSVVVAANTMLAALHSEGKLDRNLFSVCLLPTGGHLSIGDVNTTGHLSPMKFVKFTSTT